MPHSPTTPALTPRTPAHHRARPAHWAATATVIAAVIAGAGLLQPEPAGGATPAPGTRNGPQAAAAPDPRATAPDAQAVTYPLDCKGVPRTVTDTAHGDLDGDGRPETVAAVRCQAGSGTPPHALYVLIQDPAPGSAPRVVATLLDTDRRRTAIDLTVRDGAVTARLLGYSSPDVPRSSPDLNQLAKWRWTTGKFRQELTDSSAGSV
ncbi:hypothetical protein AB0D46_31560 [Streptomyces sp. NPDC048383]|uniref:hypothetical protein n=1 Tax=Streptomyces sp. NPDC048383 TaxID=3155386 RepID=UPI00342B3479